MRFCCQHVGAGFSRRPAALSPAKEAVNELCASPFPSLQRRGGCGINQKSRSHPGAADGVVAYRMRFGMHLEAGCVSDHPVRASLERDHFLMARPPLLCKEGNELD